MITLLAILGWLIALIQAVLFRKAQHQKTPKAVIVPTQHHVRVVRRTKVYDWAEEGV